MVSFQSSKKLVASKAAGERVKLLFFIFSNQSHSCSIIVTTKSKNQTLSIYPPGLTVLHGTSMYFISTTETNMQRLSKIYNKKGGTNRGAPVKLTEFFQHVS